MTRRIYFLSPDLETTRAITRELQALDIPERHIHVIGSARYSLEDLPRATLLQRTDLTHGLEKGLALGGTAGLLGGMLAVTFPPAGLVLGGGAVLLTTVTGAGFGGLISGLIASDQPNHDLEGFAENIAHGELLMLVDVPVKRLNEIKDAVVRHHPEVDIGVAHPPSH